VARPVLTICTRCDRGDELFERVKRLRKERALREEFKLDEVRCLGVCEPCVIQLEGKKRSTYLRSRVHAKHDAERVLDAARAYAALAPGEELRDRELPGDHED
jgi:predicted metal-binding protein